MGRRLKVVLYEPSGLGGICHYTYQLAEALSARGADITLLTTSKYELQHLPRAFRRRFLFKPSRVKRLLSPFFPGLRGRADVAPLDDGVEEAGPRGRALWKRVAGLRIKWLKARAAFILLVRGPDIVHVQSGARGRDLAFIRILRAFGLRVIYTAHDVLPHGEHSREEGASLARTYHSVDHIIVHSESNRQELIHLFGIERNRISVIPHGSYDFFFRDGKMAKDEARSRVGFPLDRQIVLFFGLIKRYKGLEYLLEAFRRVTASVPGARLAVVGNVFSGQREEHAFYTGILDRASRSEGVICVTEYVPVDKIRLYLSSADLVVLPYTKTYTSGVLFSAMAAGRALVVTETGGLGEIVRKGGIGLTVPPCDSAALADAIVRLLEDGERIAQMEAQAARLAATTYSWEGIADRTLGVYRSVSGREFALRPGDAGLREGTLKGLSVPPSAE